MDSMSETGYKYNEGALIKELQSYIDSTYDQHYSLNNYQATEFIIDAGHGEGFCIGNILKYAQRYGKKGGKNRADYQQGCCEPGINTSVRTMRYHIT